MSTNYIDASTPSKEEKNRTSTVKYKLRISLFFRTIAPSQRKKAESFRHGNNSNEEIPGNCLAQELCGGKVLITDMDEEGEYIIEDKVFVVDEGSPKAMIRLSKSIDNYIKNICRNKDVLSVVPCFLIPSISDTTIIPKLFFQLYAPSCILKEEQKGVYSKIDNDKGYIYFFGFDTIKSYALPKEKDIGVCAINGKLTKPLIQLSALISYYVYFYVDILEYQNWIIKRRMINDDEIRNAWNDYVKGKQSNDSVWNKVVKTFKNIVFHPVSSIKGAFDYLFNYSGHIRNRLFTRIFDVIDITCCSESKEANAIHAVREIITSCKEENRPLSMFSFFEKCYYWEYIKNNSLKDICEKWEVIDNSKNSMSTTSFWTGYGAILLSNGTDYFYGFKGTDFDSYAKDWLLTNILQGLSGLSFQHIQAVINGSTLDKQIGSRGSLWFVGHSLGGGLASVATIATKTRTGITFNAAGLNMIGVKLTQLVRNIEGVFHPSQSWKRVHPYRIKGELLDNVQKIPIKYALLTLAFLERGYGKQSIEVDVGSAVSSSASKHGINNFLYKEVMEQLLPFDDVVIKQDDNQSTNNNKIVKIIIMGKESECIVNLE